MNVAKVLRDAADVIDTRGHVKDRLVDEEGHVCALGALGVAMTGNPLLAHHDYPEGDILRIATFVQETLRRLEPQFGVRAQTEDGPGAVATWNNHFDTTPDDVKDGFRMAANEWEKQHSPDLPQKTRVPTGLASAYRAITIEPMRLPKTAPRYTPVW